MIINQQHISQKTHRTDGALELHHVFSTIQGEGPFAGMPAIFVRLHGCNLQCPYCDTDYTSKNNLVFPHELLDLVQKATVLENLIVITGGEPFRQNITPFVEMALKHGYCVQVETNGSYFLNDFPFNAATVVCSPKTGRINERLALRAHAFKYVVQAGYISEKDGLPISTLGNMNQTSVARPPECNKAEIYIQPLDQASSKLNEANIAAAVKSCRTFGYRLCIQTHKLANLE